MFKGTMKPNLWMFTKRNIQDMGDTEGLIMCDPRVMKDAKDPLQFVPLLCCCWKPPVHFGQACGFRNGNGVNEWSVCTHPMAADLADNPEADLLIALEEV